MKTKLAKTYIREFILILALAFVGACKPTSERLYNEAYAEIEKGRFRIAVDLLEKSSAVEKKNTLKFKYLAESAAIIRFEIQDYERAVRQYRKIILNSDDEMQRIHAQEAIAEIYLENLQNHSFALKELQVLEPLLKDEKTKEKTKLKISQAQYFTGNYQQALDEINISLKTANGEKLNFLKLKAQVLVAEKKYKEALQVFNNIYEQSPVFFEKENLFMATSVVYEENEDFKEALEYLYKFEKQIKDKQYFELRIKRLKQRLMNKPLFRGKRK